MSAPAPARKRLAARLLACPGLTAVVAAALVGLAAFVLWWFEPQALLFDRVVDEEFPAVTEAEGEAETEPDESGDVDDVPAAAADAPTGPQVLTAGRFGSRNRYTVTGEATVHELADGSRTLRLEPFESTN